MNFRIFSLLSFCFITSVTPLFSMDNGLFDVNGLLRIEQPKNLPITITRAWFDTQGKNAPDLFLEIKNRSTLPIAYVGYLLGDCVHCESIWIGHGDPTSLGMLRPWKDEQFIPAGGKTILKVPGKAYKYLKENSKECSEGNSEDSRPPLYFQHILFSDGSGWLVDHQYPKPGHRPELNVESVSFVASNDPKRKNLKEWKVADDGTVDVIIELKANDTVSAGDVNIALSVDDCGGYKDPFGCEINEIVQPVGNEGYLYPMRLQNLPKNLLKGEKVSIVFKNFPVGRDIQQYLAREFRFWKWGLIANVSILNRKGDKTADAHGSLRVVEGLPKDSYDVFFKNLCLSQKKIKKSASIHKQKNKILLYPLFSIQDYRITDGTDQLAPGPPFKMVDANAPPVEIGNILLEVLNASPKDVPYAQTPTDMPLKPFWELAGVGSWEEFDKGSIKCDVEDDGKSLEFLPYQQNGEEIVDGVFKMDRQTSPEQIGLAVLKALSKAK